MKLFARIDILNGHVFEREREREKKNIIIVHEMRGERMRRLYKVDFKFLEKLKEQT